MAHYEAPCGKKYGDRRSDLQRGMHKLAVQVDFKAVIQEDHGDELRPSRRVMSMIVANDHALFCSVGNCLQHIRA